MPGSFNKTHVKEGNKIVLTAYFTDPNTICTGNRATTPGYIGDNLYLPMENGVVKIPLKESDLVSGDNKWVKGRCFFGMGEAITFSSVQRKFSFQAENRIYTTNSPCSSNFAEC